MSEQDKQQAREHLGRARRQGRNAARNTTRAAKLAGEAAAEDTAEALKHAADGTREFVSEAAEEVVEETKRHAPKLSARGLAAISGDTGTGFLALAVSLYSGAIAVSKFRSAIEGRGRATS